MYIENQNYNPTAEEFFRNGWYDLTGRTSANIALENLNYQKEFNDLTMERADNAIQRQVEDLHKAGLSSQLVGSGSSVGNITSPQLADTTDSAFNNVFNSLSLVDKMVDTSNNLADSVVDNKLKMQELNTYDGFGFKPQTKLGKVFTELFNLLPDTMHWFFPDGVDKTVSDVVSDTVKDVSTVVQNTLHKKAEKIEKREARKEKRVANKEKFNKFIKDLASTPVDFFQKLFDLRYGKNNPFLNNS